LIGLSTFGLLSNFSVAATFENFTYESNGTSVTITDYPVEAIGPVLIPDTIVGLPVTAIGDTAFKDCIRLTQVSIPDSVVSIGIQAGSGFFSVKMLKSIGAG
jgi:hypothetical protein